MRNLLGAKLKVVYGYKGSAEVKLAMNRGEVQGICGLPISTIKSFWGDEYRAGEFKPIIQLSGKPHPDLKGIPHVDRYAKTDEDRQVFDLIFGAQALGRVYVSPPGQPAARTKALRDALMATMKDDKFLADAAKAQDRHRSDERRAGRRYDRTIFRRIAGSGGAGESGVQPELVSYSSFALRPILGV